MKISLRRGVACKVSRPRMVEIDVFAALARSRGDIKIASWENLEGHLIVLFPYKPEAQGYWKKVGKSLFYFLGVSL